MPGGKHITPQQLGWVAGVIDFKGKISRKRAGGRVTPLLVLRVDSTNLAIGERLCALTGMKAEPREPRVRDDVERRGCVEHCPEPHVHTSFETGRMRNWRVSGAAAAIVLYNVLPYMATDEGMTALMEEIIGNTILRGRRGNSARQAAERLVNLGWKLPPGIRQQYASLALRQQRSA